MNVRYFPPVTAIVGLGKLAAGRVRFKGHDPGTEFILADGERHRIFRVMQAAPESELSGGSVVRLTIRFRFARFSPGTNQVLSLLPVPVITGMPGILQKIWTYCDETGYSQGIYLFESKAFAEAYLGSPVVRVLKGRTAEGSFSWDIEDGGQGAQTPDAADQEKEAASGTDT
jgi:hypothetical protein